jgi:hypothetical protein
MRSLPFLLSALLLIGGTAAAHGGAEHSDAEKVQLTLRPAPKKLSMSTIEFADFYRFGPQAPELTEKVMELHGKKVTLVGFMVEMSMAPKGGFYLAPYPALCDESGAGRAGLPPVSVLVVAPSAKGKPIAHVPGALEVTGVLDVGNKESADGEVWTIRLLVQDTKSLKFARTRTRDEVMRASRVSK